MLSNAAVLRGSSRPAMSLANISLISGGLAKAARLGTYAAAQVVARYGCRLDGSLASVAAAVLGDLG